MAKQYVGARYVPITYENPDDGSANWKANVEYEPLTIVVASNGDSYTSKKAVPRSVGAPQDNPEYWVKTGDFNASLLALQGRVNTIEGDLNTPVTGIKAKVSAIETQNGNETLETIAQTLSGGINEVVNDINNLLKTIPNVHNVVELGADNSGTSDNATLFNTIFANHDYDKHTFYFPDGVYLIDETVLVNNGANLLLSGNAIIKANATMDYMFEFNTVSVAERPYYIFNADYLYANMSIKGGIFDGDSKAGTCIHARRFCNFTIEGVRVINFNTCGIDCRTHYSTETEQTAELKVLNCYVSNFNNKTASAIGVDIESDNMIDNCLIVDCLYGLRVYGSNQVSNTHIWCSNSYPANDGSAIVVTHNQNNFVNIYTDCYFNGFDLQTGGVTHIENYSYYVIDDHYVNFNRSIIHSSNNTGGTLFIHNMSVDSPRQVSFTNIAYKNKVYVDGFYSRNTYGLPISQIIPCMDKLYSYFWDTPLDEISDDLPTGIYGCKVATNYKPDTGSRGVLLNIVFPDHNIRIYLDYNTGNILTQFNQALGSDWFNLGTGSTTASRINT